MKIIMLLIATCFSASAQTNFTDRESELYRRKVLDGLSCTNISTTNSITIYEEPITNIIISQSFTGTIQIGTNFFTLRDLDHKPQIQVSYADRFWRDIPGNEFSAPELYEAERLYPIKFRIK